MRDVPAADALVSLTAEQGADLLVMGAYGRPRLRELVMGGTTRRVLEQMTVPVLLAHWAAAAQGSHRSNRAARSKPVGAAPSPRIHPQ